MPQKVSEPDNVRYTYLDRMLRQRLICDLDLPYDRHADQRPQVTSCTLNVRHNALLRRVSQLERDHQEALRDAQNEISRLKKITAVLFSLQLFTIGVLARVAFKN